jgi:hypothetical protein
VVDESLGQAAVIGDVSLAMGKRLFGKRLLKQELQFAFYPQPVPAITLKSANAWLGRKQLKSYLEDESHLNANLETLSRRDIQIRLPVVIVTGDSDKIVSAQANAYRLKCSDQSVTIDRTQHTGHEIPQTDPQSIRTASL